MFSDTKISILVVEDNPADQFFVSELIEASPIIIKSLFIAETAKAALSLLKGESVDIILLDLSLPDSFGIDTFKIIHKHSRTIPIIILSGQSDMKLAIEAITLGSQDYLIKGEFDEKLLSKTIRYSMERIQNLKALEESIERFNLVSQATNDMVWDWNLATGEFYRSKEGWRKIFGAAESDTPSYISESWTSFVHPDDKEMVWAYINKIYQSKDQHIFELENRALREDGTVAYVLNRGYLIRDETGKPVRLTGATQDITEKKISEQILKASEERFRYLFNNNPACILLWDPENLKILEVNDTAMAQYGYTQKALLEMSILDLSIPEDHDFLQKFAKEAKSNYQLKHVRTSKFIHHTGEIIYMDINSHVILYSGVPLVLVLASNVTGKVLLEQELEAGKLRKQFEITEAVISGQESERQEIGRELHDNINQILASSRLFLGLSKTASDHSFIDKADNLVSSAITEIRNLSHALIPAILHESELTKALEQIFEAISWSSHIAIHKNFEGFEEDALSEKFKLAIFRIVQEQINNIHKYAKAENVWLTLGKEESKLILRIKDDGVGFDTTKKSAGVGLVNIKTRASLFNGEVTLVSSVGKGTALLIVFDGI